VLRPRRRPAGPLRRPLHDRGSPRGAGAVRGRRGRRHPLRDRARPRRGDAPRGGRSGPARQRARGRRLLRRDRAPGGGAPHGDGARAHALPAARPRPRRLPRAFGRGAGAAAGLRASGPGAAGRAPGRIRFPSRGAATMIPAQVARIGLAFNLKPPLALSGDPRNPDDRYAEWDDEATIGGVEAALSRAGEVVRLEADADLPLRLRAARPDIVFNIAEGLYGPNREAHVPAICEFWSVPYTGSDPMTLSLCLDKGRTKEILAHNKIATAPFVV